MINDENNIGTKEKKIGKRKIFGLLLCLFLIGIVSAMYYQGSTPPVIEEPTVTPTPIVSPTPAPAIIPEPTILPTATPTPVTVMSGRFITVVRPEGGGGGFTSEPPQEPVLNQQEPDLNLVVCDEHGENCKEDLDVLAFFKLENVVPGANGNAKFSLKNIGNLDGKVSMNITNVVSSPGETAEPEPIPDNGELDECLYIDVTAGNAGYVRDLENKEIELGELKAGKILPVELKWNISAEAGNKIMGDTVSFDIEFELVEN